MRLYYIEISKDYNNLINNKLGRDKLSNKNIMKSTIAIMIITIISKLLGFGRESLIASVYGTSFSSDIYVFGIGITGMLFASIGDAIRTTFIPMLSDYIEHKSFEERNYFVNNILNIVFILSLILMFIGVAFGKYILLIFGPGFATKYSQSDFISAITLTKIMFVSLIFISIQNVLSAILQAHKEFVVPASMSIFYNIIIIGFLILFGKTYGAKGLIITLLVAYAIQAIIHIPKYKALGYKYKFVFNLKDNGVKTILTLVVPVLIGTSISQVNFLVDRMLATNVGEGAISTMNFANKLNLLIHSIISVSITTVIYSTLSSLNSKSDTEGYTNVLTKATNILCLVMLPATVGMMVLRLPLVNLAFRRGAFSADAAILTSSVLLFYAPGVTALGIRDIFNRAFYAIKDTKTAMINGAIGVIINIVLNLILVQFMGLNGLAFATSISSIVTTVLLIYSLNRRIKFGIKPMLSSFTKILISSVIMGIVVHYSYGYIANMFSSGTMGQLLSLGFTVLIGVIVYVILMEIIKIKEYVELKNVLVRGVVKKLNGKRLGAKAI